VKTLTVLILAKSYKKGGRCIAGKTVQMLGGGNIELGAWVRPVSGSIVHSNAMNETMYTYSDGSEVRTLDIVEMPIICNKPLAGQPENYLIDESQCWRKVGQFTASNVPCIVDDAADIWSETDVASNIVTPIYSQNHAITQSLYLIKPSALLVTLSNNYNDYSNQFKRRIVASFQYNGTHYNNIPITCPAVCRVFTNQYPQQGASPKTIALKKGDNYVMCMSLAPPFGKYNHQHKLVATMFDYDGYLQRVYAA